MSSSYGILELYYFLKCNPARIELIDGAPSTTNMTSYIEFKLQLNQNSYGQNVVFVWYFRTALFPKMQSSENRTYRGTPSTTDITSYIRLYMICPY